MNSKLSRYGNKRMLLFLLLSGFTIFLLWYFFHPLSPYNKRIRYVAVFDEIGPVDDGKNVKVGGIPKGRIVHIDKTDSALYVKFELASEIRIPKDSRLHFASAGFLGNREIEIALGISSENYSAGDTIFGTVFDKGLGTAREDLDESLWLLKTVLDSVRTFFDALDSGEEGKQIKRVAQKGKHLASGAESSFENLKNELDKLFEELSASAEKMDAEWQKISGGIEASEEAFTTSMEGLKRLRSTAQMLDIQVSEALEKLDKNDNSASLILQKGGSVSVALKNVQTNIKNLVLDVKKNGIKLNVDFF